MIMSTKLPNHNFFSRASARSRDDNHVQVDNPKGDIGLTTLVIPPATAIAELIFVHGLGGGSRSTWTKDSNDSLFWPQHWLREDEAFQNVGIHTFGYNSNWGKGSILNIHDFARALLVAIHENHQIARTSKSPIVFICHSMGGLVVKKAYLLARQLEEYATIEKRINTIVFLGTPHRGSDMASILSRILSLSPGARPFLDELKPGSIATQTINDEFAHQCQSLRLRSFFETLPMFGKSLIVERESAILCLPNETPSYMNTNHREICKFPSRHDENYRSLRNALASIVDDCRGDLPTLQHDFQVEDLAYLDECLEISDAIEDDFSNSEARRLKGSCEWLSIRESFVRWRDAEGVSLYWIHARPATGKTVLSASVVQQLRASGYDCGFYFFDNGHKAKANVGSLLRSMAWQMAQSDPHVLKIVLDICRKNPQIAKSDHRTIWRKLFMDGILKSGGAARQYWVIDALDECRNDSELYAFLSKTINALQLRVFITSRNTYSSCGKYMHGNIPVIEETICESDTMTDISMYLKANMDSIPAVDEGDRYDIVGTILQRSAGCFLWVNLVVEELRKVHTSTEVKHVLADIPSDMNALYLRILHSMSEATYGRQLAKAILSWTLCAARPLTTEELHLALQLDIRDSVDNIEKAITACCGQLVYVDAKSRVHIIHQTARDYLLKPGNTSEFAVDKKNGHKRLLLTCLQQLCNDESGNYRPRRLSAQALSRPYSPLNSYVCSALPDHLSHVSSTDDDIFLALVAFLNTPNVLSWIERLAQVPDLNRIIQCGHALKNYLRRRSRSLSPIGKDIATLDSWATDLIRIVAKFGKQLVESPSSIYSLIPPFCPPESAIKQLFAATARGLTVLGLSAEHWDDCLSSIIQPGEQFTALAHGDNLFALGASSGKLLVFDEVTCQPVRTLDHQESIRRLAFGRKRDLLASSGMKNVCVWDMCSWQQLWKVEISHDCLSLSFTDEDKLLLGALRNNEFIIWDCDAAEAIDVIDWTACFQGKDNRAYRRPVNTAISVESNLLAIIYRAQDLLVWDIENNEIYDTYSKQSGALSRLRLDEGHHKPWVTGGLVFSSDPHVLLLAASYSDGELVIFDLENGSVKERVLANAQTLVSSPSGRTLAAADSAGEIKIYDFETLKLLHCITSGDYAVKSLAFSADNCRLLDIRMSECRVWDPIILLRTDEDDDNSDTVSILTMPHETQFESAEDVPMISCMTCVDDYIFCGKTDGGVYTYEKVSGVQQHRLYSHGKNIAVSSLTFDVQSNTLSSVDSSSRTLSYRVNRSLLGWAVVGLLFDHRVGVAVEQILSNQGSSRILASTRDECYLFSFDHESDAQNVTKHVNPQKCPHLWANHPSESTQLIMLSNEEAQLREWDSLHLICRMDLRLLEDSVLASGSVRSLNSFAEQNLLAAVIESASALQTRSQYLMIWSARDIFIADEKKHSVRHDRGRIDHVQQVLGMYQQKVIFLQDNGWICSLNVDVLSHGHHTRHFFIPVDWLSAGSSIQSIVTENGDVIIVRGSEIAVIQNGLEICQQGSSRSGSKSPLRAKRPGLSARGSGSNQRLFTRLPERKRPSLQGKLFTNAADDKAFEAGQPTFK